MGGCVVEPDVRVASQPAVVLRFVGIQVVQDDVEFGVRVQRDEAVHEVEELSASPPTVMADMGDAGVDFQCREQGGRAVTLVLEALASEGAAIGEPQPALGTLERLDRRLLVHADHQCILGWVEVEADDVSRFLTELGRC